MNSHIQRIMILICFTLLTTAFAQGGSKPSESIVFNKIPITELRPDLKLVLGAIMKRMRKEKLPADMPVVFAPGTEKIFSDSFDYKGFRLGRVSVLSLKRSEHKKNHLVFKASISFIDGADRRANLVITARFGASAKNILIDACTVETFNPPDPEADFYVVPAQDVPRDFSKQYSSHADIIAFLSQKALAYPLKNTVSKKPQEYYIFLIVKERVSPGAKFDIQIGKDPIAPEPMKDTTVDLDFMGWHVATTRVKFVPGLRPERFLKAYYTPGNTISKDLRKPIFLQSISTLMGVSGGGNSGGATKKKLSPVADAYVYAYSYRNWDKANWGACALKAGWHPTGGQSRTFLKFDLSGVDLKGMKNAKLRLYQNHTAGSPTLKLGVYEVTGKWIEGRGTYHSGKTEKPAAYGEITWIAQPSFAKSPTASFFPGAEIKKYVEVDVTDLAKSWASGKPNHGLVIAPIGPLGNRESVYGFCSREDKDKTKRPALIIQSAGKPDDPDEPHDTPDDPDDPDEPHDTPDNPDDPRDTPDKPDIDRLQVRAANRQVRPKTSIIVPVWLDFPKTFSRTRDGRVNVANLNVEIIYDPRVITPGGKVLPGNLMRGSIFQANTAKAGVIKIGFASKGRVQTNGTLAQIPFRVVGRAGQRSPLNVRITTVNDEKGRTPKAIPVNGYVQILKAGVPGDINGNGIVDAGDALAALKMSVDLMKEDLILNVDKQNGVTSNDARLLLKMAVQNTTVPQFKEGRNATSKNGSVTPDSDDVRDEDVRVNDTQNQKRLTANKAYQEYIAAYNKLTSLMAKGKGDTPAAQSAYKAYKLAKAKYEAAIKDKNLAPAKSD